MPNRPPAHPEVRAHSQTWPIWPSDCGLALKSHLASMEEPEDQQVRPTWLCSSGSARGAKGATREAWGLRFSAFPSTS